MYFFKLVGIWKNSDSGFRIVSTIDESHPSIELRQRPSLLSSFCYCLGFAGERHWYSAEVCDEQGLKRVASVWPKWGLFSEDRKVVVDFEHTCTDEETRAIIFRD